MALCIIARGYPLPALPPAKCGMLPIMLLLSHGGYPMPCGGASVCCIAIPLPLTPLPPPVAALPALPLANPWCRLLFGMCASELGGIAPLPLPPRPAEPRPPSAAAPIRAACGSRLTGSVLTSGPLPSGKAAAEAGTVAAVAGELRDAERDAGREVPPSAADAVTLRIFPGGVPSRLVAAVASDRLSEFALAAELDGAWAEEDAAFAVRRWSFYGGRGGRQESESQDERGAPGEKVARVSGSERPLLLPSAGGPCFPGLTREP